MVLEVRDEKKKVAELQSSLAGVDLSVQVGQHGHANSEAAPVVNGAPVANSKAVRWRLSP
jgi:hypothetical protein